MARELERRGLVIGVVGRSGVGKTSLLEHLIPALEAAGAAVGAAKHASHGFLADQPGKDSHRLYASGARAVALLSVEQSVTFVRRCEPPALDAALAALPADLDLVLAEGFSWEPIPRVVVTGPGREPRSEDLTGGEVVAVVTVRAYPDARPPRFDPTELEALLHRLLGRLAEEVGPRSRRVLPAAAVPEGGSRRPTPPGGTRRARPEKRRPGRDDGNVPHGSLVPSGRPPHPICTASIEIDPPSTPSTGKRTGSARCAAPST
jgi:molybdopterin-guanine dinucleotide biosynthesis protein B